MNSVSLIGLIKRTLTLLVSSSWSNGTPVSILDTPPRLVHAPNMSYTDMTYTDMSYTDMSDTDKSYTDIPYIDIS